MSEKKREKFRIELDKREFVPVFAGYNAPITIGGENLYPGIDVNLKIHLSVEGMFMCIEPLTEVAELMLKDISTENETDW